MTEDREVDEVFAHLQVLDPQGERWDRVIRGTFDQLYDGQRTGRYRWDQLYKTEKTHFGTLIEINAQREFRFADGEILDYEICGHEVDCKYSQSYAWMLPPEVFGRLCLVVSASDEGSTFAVGVVRASQENLGLGRNRDAKASLSAHGREDIRWLYRSCALTPNLLLQISHELAAAILDERKSGQARVNELFRKVQHSLITRTVVATVARQDDFMKRVRYNGGARSALQPEGIVILGGDYEGHRQLARSLRLPTPPPGGFVSARVTHAAEGEADSVTIDGQLWRVAFDGDPAVPAPRLPAAQRGAAA